MARTRKQWLETFLHLADSGAAALDYRKKLGIKTNVLSKHVNRLGEYRSELATLKAEEKRLEERRLKKERLLAESRQRASSMTLGNVKPTEVEDDDTE